MQRYLQALLLFGLASLSGCSAAPSNKPLDLKFTAVDGRQVDLANLRGKVVLIDFWATWCPPCVAISPDIVQLYKKYHSQGLEIVGISADSDKKALLDFVKKEGAPWPQYFETGDDNVLLQKLGVDSFPTLWLLNKKGVVVDPDFRNYWVVSFGIPIGGTPPATIQKIDAAIEKQLSAP